MKEYQGKLEHSAENAVCFPDVSRGSSFSSELKVDLELKGRIVDVQVEDAECGSVDNPVPRSALFGRAGRRCRCGSSRTGDCRSSQPRPFGGATNPHCSDSNSFCMGHDRRVAASTARDAPQWCTLFDMWVAVFSTRDLDVDGMVGFTAVLDVDVRLPAAVILQIRAEWATTGGLPAQGPPHACSDACSHAYSHACSHACSPACSNACSSNACSSDAYSDACSLACSHACSNAKGFSTHACSDACSHACAHACLMFAHRRTTRQFRSDNEFSKKGSRAARLVWCFAGISQLEPACGNLAKQQSS